MKIPLMHNQSFLPLAAKIKHILAASLSATGLCFLLAGPAMSMEADISVGQKSIRFTASTSDVRVMLVGIVGPDGNTMFTKNSNGAPITWALPVGAVDGFYQYEVKLSTAPPRLRARTEMENRFSSATSSTDDRVETRNGSVLVKNGSLVNPAQLESSSKNRLWKHTDKIVTLVFDTLLPSAHADIVHNDDVIANFSMCIGNDCVNGESFGFDTLRLKENNLRINFDDTSTSSSFPRNDWRIIINDSSNGGASYFAVEDATAGRQVFRVAAGAPSNALTVDSQGDVGIGTLNAVVELHIKDGDSPTTRFEQDGSSGFTPQTWDVAGNETNFFIRDVTNGSKLPFKIKPGAATNSLFIDGNGNVGIGLDPDDTKKLEVLGDTRIHGNLEIVELEVTSSRTQKKQIEDLNTQEALNTLRALQPVSFYYKHSPEEQAIGFIAEDVPDLVATDSRRTLNPMDIVAVLTKVVQEQQQAIEKLSAQLESLTAQNSQVE